MQFSLGFLAGAVTMLALLWLLADLAEKLGDVGEMLDGLYMELS